ncbi:hypothetical protein [Chitinophaga cymbidii]|uniref:Uncharacterized protein n=1 Tax=Chitinophaga cymbidii TaxID=1096750 RepID=A0A512RJL9_9BACT|nr:hypothetical protein [Chitinophaga cymbidii]GEP95903.1 hypothetical protein CCY01nite_21630 [Chitinophaga cymbidii]
MSEFEDLQAGALGLLHTTCDVLNKVGAKYIIVGGWAPYLLNSNPIQHPGTKDVDVLFEGAYEKGILKEIIEALLAEEYILSAKHDFQLFKKCRVQGREFIYNVDLLHPMETIIPKNIYVEHIDLGIPADKYQGKTFKMKSIALPSAQSLFRLNMFNLYKSDKPEYATSYVPLMDEAGTLITKSQSVKIEKRYRDSLDIYLTINQSRSIENLINTVKKIQLEDIDTYNSLFGIREMYDDNKLFENVRRYVEVKHEEFVQTMESFFEKTGLMNKAES